MGDWLSDHSYLATWLALPVAIILTLIQNKGKKISEINLSRLLIYVVFLISVGVVLNSSFDETARNFSQFFAGAALGFLVVDSRRSPKK